MTRGNSPYISKIVRPRNRPANHSQAHHNVVSLRWHMRAKDCEALKAAGSDLPMLEETGRIRFDCRYDQPPG